MSDWAAKRFWTNTQTQAKEGGFVVTLDGREVKTPAKSSLILPSLGMAEAIAAEWDAQEDLIKPATMPMTRTANSAVDTVAHNFEHVVETLAQYGNSDLICYYAEHPQSLLQEQRAAWTPLHEWLTQTYGITLTQGSGVVFVPQPDGTEAQFQNILRQFSPFELAGLHDLISLSGSIVIGLAAAQNVNRITDLWNASIVDELWNIQQWGEDEEQQNYLELRRASFQTAYEFFKLSKSA